jgi:hypothetical protein
MTRTIFHALFSVTLLAACGGAKPAVSNAAAVPATPQKPSTKAETRSDPALATCHSSFKPADKDPSADVDAMAKGCADVTKMTQVGTTLTGEATEGKSITFPFPAKAGKCYRVYAVSLTTMQDFDLAVVDSAGDLVAADSTDDVSPVLAEDGKFCFKVADAATLRATAGTGAGKFAVEIWSD